MFVVSLCPVATFTWSPLMGCTLVRLYIYRRYVSVAFCDFLLWSPYTFPLPRTGKREMYVEWLWKVNRLLIIYWRWSSIVFSVIDALGDLHLARFNSRLYSLIFHWWWASVIFICNVHLWFSFLFILEYTLIFFNFQFLFIRIFP